jgi:uncharacterized protein YjbI with pentapeptide repeats
VKVSRAHTKAKPRPARIPPCPGCKSTDVIPIVWGLPGPDLEDQEAAGELVLGGCCVDDDSPGWHCRGCGREFGKIAAPRVPTRKQTTVTTDVRFGASDCATIVFDGGRFEDCLFDHCALQGRDLRGAKFIDCAFDTCDLAVVGVVDCTFLRSRFSGCRLSGVNWSLARTLESVVFDGCQLNDGTFLGLRLSACEFVRCVACATSFRDAILSRAKFCESDLSRAEFVNCDLRGADFRGALNYVISPADNRLEKARFSLPEAITLLTGLGIVVD